MTPLLYQAAQNHVYGQRYEFESGSITDAMFVFLDGVPSPESLGAVERDYRLRPLVCLTDDWEKTLKKEFSKIFSLERHRMVPAREFVFPDEKPLPDGFRVELFEERAFALHPFGHGENYPTCDDFLRDGAGAVVWHGDSIVASASSFLSFRGEVELDVSTEEAYRGLGLASACVARMLRECQRKGLTVHWDAQNDISRHMAEKFGFTVERSYPMYILPGK